MDLFGWQIFLCRGTIRFVIESTGIVTSLHTIRLWTKNDIYGVEFRGLRRVVKLVSLPRKTGTPFSCPSTGFYHRL